MTTTPLTVSGGVISAPNNAANPSSISSSAASAASAYLVLTQSQESAISAQTAFAAGQASNYPSPGTTSQDPSTSTSRFASDGGATPSSHSQSSFAHPTTAPSSQNRTQEHSGSSAQHGVADGTVAGIGIGIAIGVAIVTFLVTFAIMRRKPRSRDAGGFTANSRHVDRSEVNNHGEKPNEGFVRQATTRSNRGFVNYENYLPQSADDTTVRQRVKSTLDQVELHVENFYQTIIDPSFSSKTTDKELSVLNSPHLPRSLNSLLAQPSDKVSLIKHALAYLITSSIATNTKPTESLLPIEFLDLPNSLAATKAANPPKPGTLQ